MVAALLHLGINKKLPALPKSIEASAVGDVAYAAGAANKNRLLICAPSNAAVDELLTRLSLGILSSEGIEGSNEGLRLLKLVRLGNVSESSNEMIEEFTLERQTEDMLRQSKEWHDFVDVEQRIKIMLKRIESEMVDQEGKDKKMLKLLLVRLHQEKQRKKIEMDRRRCLIRYIMCLSKVSYLTLPAFRFDLLDKADVVLATLSGAGSHHFVDYIEGNIGFDAQGNGLFFANRATYSLR